MQRGNRAEIRVVDDPREAFFHLRPHLRPWLRGVLAREILAVLAIEIMKTLEITKLTASTRIA